MPCIRRVLLYPIKSLDAQEVSAAQVLPSGALEHDRAYAIVDANGDFVNGKRYPSIHCLRSRLDLASRQLTLHDASDRGLGSRTFCIEAERRDLCKWLGAFFGFAVDLVEDRATGFPDDPESPGPTFIGTTTLAEIGQWFRLEMPEVRARFRANIEIDAAPAFWEDGLFGTEEAPPVFTVGSARFLGINPCQRCVVPPRNPWTGTNDPGFAKRFAELRRETLPDWAPRARFNHFYRVAVNTRLESWTPGTSVQVGDAVAQIHAAPVLQSH